LEQAVLNLGEDWMLDFDDVYEATEDWVQGRGDLGWRQLVAEIDFLFSVEPDTRARMKHFATQYAFTDQDDSFDVWLRALQTRAKEALAGIHSNPMSDPTAR
jgi:hypothetical protein